MHITGFLHIKSSLLNDDDSVMIEQYGQQFASVYERI